jgi:hypothetical protein
MPTIITGTRADIGPVAAPPLTPTAQVMRGAGRRVAYDIGSKGNVPSQDPRR